MVQALKHTPLYELHLSHRARMVPFAGWEMPLQFSGILAETRAVRTRAGLFDVSHMGRVSISGNGATQLLDWLFTASIAAMTPYRARYTLLCNEQGGIIDDCVIYRLEEERYLLVCNAANRERVVPWLRRWAGERAPGVSIEDQTETTAMIAFQGPDTPRLLDPLSEDNPSSLRYFTCMYGVVAGKRTLIGRTGYTGEDGFEFILPGGDAPHLWQTLVGLGAAPCGLGARDLLRLEAGLLLHGSDMDTSTTPLEAGLERFVRLEKDFIGADVLRKQKEEGLRRRLVGLRLLGQGIPRQGYPILAGGREIGRVTSGSYSPTLDRGIALGYVSVEHASPGTRLAIDIRGRESEAEVVPLPFYTRKRSQ